MSRTVLSLVKLVLTLKVLATFTKKGFPLEESRTSLLIYAVWPFSILLADKINRFILISLKLTMV